MHKDLSQVEFYFPEGNFENKDEIANKIVNLIKERGSIEYCGYADEVLLKNGITNNIGNGNVSNYKNISDQQKKEIENIISNTINFVDDNLKVPTKNFIFVHPYFPTDEDNVFDGVMAVAVYSCVFHIFIDLNQYTKNSLENTVAHELNHTIYYYNHYDDFNDYVLLDKLIMEGLAENFREQHFDPKISPWSGALAREQALKILKESQDLIKTKDEELMYEFMFGSKKYERWTGYSVGYWLVKEFIDKNKSMSWDDLMNLDKEKFLQILE